MSHRWNLAAWHPQHVRVNHPRQAWPQRTKTVWQYPTDAYADSFRIVSLYVMSGGIIAGLARRRPRTEPSPQSRGSTALCTLGRRGRMGKARATANCRARVSRTRRPSRPTATTCTANHPGAGSRGHLRQHLVVTTGSTILVRAFLVVRLSDSAWTVSARRVRAASLFYRHLRLRFGGMEATARGPTSPPRGRGCGRPGTTSATRTAGTPR